MAVVPERLTNFNRTQSELEQLLIFSVAVAGNKAKRVAPAVERFFDGALEVKHTTPVHWLKFWFDNMGEEFVVERLKNARTGKYARLTQFFKELVANTPSIETLNVNDLRKFHGISFKTAKMIVLHSKPGERHAVIDTHILKFLRDVVPVEVWDEGLKIPEATPQSEKLYTRLENLFLDWIDARIEYQKHICIPKKGGGLMDRCVVIERDPLTGKANYAKLDLDLWNIYSGNGGD